MGDKISLYIRDKDSGETIELDNFMPDPGVIKFLEERPDRPAFRVRTKEDNRGFVLYGCRVVNKTADAYGCPRYEVEWDEKVFFDEEEYPREWPERAKNVKDAADWRCVRCGHPHESPKERIPCDDKCDLTKHIEIAHIATMLQDEDEKLYLFRRADNLWPSQRQRVLTVHHLDGQKYNLAWWNLAALCQVCHLQIQGKVNMFQQYPLEHSSWFRPYVAGFYARVYLDQYLERAEVEERMDELLALERRI